MSFLKSYTKKEKSWMMYDWAHSAHSVIVVTLLPIFYNAVAEYTSDAATSMSTWGYCTSIAMLVIAFLAPILGALSDFKGFRKKMLLSFMIVGVLSCAILAFIPLISLQNTQVAERVGLAVLVLYIISQIGYSGANLFYDSFLVDVTTNDRMDKVSTMGYGLGYIGGSTIPLLGFLILNMVGVEMIYCLSFAFGFTAIWWLVFSYPILKNVEQTSYVPRKKHAIRNAFKGLGITIKKIFKIKSMFVFLIAYFFYIDGVGTIIHMSTTYGDTLGINATQMMLAMLLVQLLGLPFALLYIKLSQKFGAMTMVGVGICIYMFICVFGFFIRSEWQFWVLAVLVSTSQGGIQALSRSIFGKMIPDKTRSGEFFGFYDIFGRFSAILGPSVFGLSSVIAANIIKQRNNIGANASSEVLSKVSEQAAPWGVLSVLLIFIVGAVLFFIVLPKCIRKEKAEFRPIKF